eukprot:TRINITY_DN54217_c0_g1_i1.p1 TRINITY_DN54217_c0_g1~~TRINITY_DN54217_c0_g1_i1.p1  ORF type:complete len:652 (-),score=142.64 TRINITY_DN54217_c0_g1_i1:65-2020(-)
MSLEDALNSCIVIDNLPVVTKEKYQKLQTLISRIVNHKELKEVGSVKRFELCQDAEGTTTGFAFVEYDNPSAAAKAQVKMNGQKLDKQHTLLVSLFTDWEKFKDTPDEYEEPEQVDFHPVTNLHSYLTDPSAREQYMVRYGDDTEIVWNDPIAFGKQQIANKQKDWTDMIARWSPLGSYLATFHSQGIQLWGGEKFELQGRFPHAGVQLIDFSPKEKFLVTWFQNICVWDVATQRRLRTFVGGPTPDHEWPILKWSYDEKFFARHQDDNIHVYETEQMKLIQPDPRKQTTLFIQSVRDFEWSPTDNYLSYWVPEVGDKPARVALLKVTQKGEKVDFEQATQKNLYRVQDIRMHWQSEGHFLCVKVDRCAKGSKEKRKVTNFELFRLRSATQPIAVDVVELTDEVVAFAWEPKGLRFAIIHGAVKNQVSIYTMSGIRDGNVRKLVTLENKNVNYLYWSPKGNHIVLAGLKGSQGNLEFYNVNELYTMGQAEHFMCTDVEWDPSGRFVTSYVSFFRHQMENGYYIWTFQGKQLVHVTREKLMQFLWRPRPPSLLSADRLKVIQRELKDRREKYQKEEEELERAEAEQIERERREKMNQWASFIKMRREDFRELTEKRRACRRNCDWHSDDERSYRVEERVEEEVLETRVEPVN